MNPHAATALRPELKKKIETWILSFHRLDPRYKILTFFNLVAREGADNITQETEEDYDLDRGSSHHSIPNDDDPMLHNQATQTLVANVFDVTSILTVWRPTSNDAMRKMMEGTGVGKGLDIKGKSAKRGKLSGYVPFLQIHQESHKSQILPIPTQADMRVYYSTEEQRDLVWDYLKEFYTQMQAEKQKLQQVQLRNDKDGTVAAMSKSNIHFDHPRSSTTAITSSSRIPSPQSPQIKKGGKPDAPSPLISSSSSLSKSISSTNIPSRMKKIDNYRYHHWYGMEISQRLFWQATICSANIARNGTGTETGRPSTPGFQDANLQTLRTACHWAAKDSSIIRHQHPQNYPPNHKISNHHHLRPLPVVVQTSSSLLENQEEHLTGNETIHDDTAIHGSSSTTADSTDNDNSSKVTLARALNPLYLVMAYEEDGRIKPVVSDFDAFLLGWRREALWFGCNLPREQEELMLWCIDQIEMILNEKQQQQEEESLATDTWTCRWLDVLKRETHNGGFHPNIPEYGFGDPKSYSIMEQAALRLKSTGAVRHGSECFNYYFPQEIDDVFLLISDTLRPVRWRYVNVQELQSILSQKIAEGFVFPLNPKWILCDPGWKKLYDELMASDALYADLSKDVWYPPFSGVRERIEKIYKQHPHGFQPQEGKVCRRGSIEQANKTGYSPLRQNLHAGEKLSGNSAFDLAELELDNYVRHSVKHTLARQIMDAHLEDLHETDKGDEEEDDETDYTFARESTGNLSTSSAPSTKSAGSACSKSSNRSGLLTPTSMRELFRKQRQIQKREEPRYRSEAILHTCIDPKDVAATASGSGASMSCQVESATNSSARSRCLVNHDDCERGSGDSAPSTGKETSHPESRDSDTAHKDKQSKSFNLRMILRKHMSSLIFPRRNLNAGPGEEVHKSKSHN